MTTISGGESRIITFLLQDIDQLLRKTRLSKFTRWCWAADMKEAVRYIRQLERVVRRFEGFVDKEKYHKELLAMNYGYDRRLEAKRIEKAAREQWMREPTRKQV